MSASAHTLVPTGAPWLTRALAVSAMLHAVVVATVVVATQPSHEREADLVDIEVAPPPPKAEALPEEKARAPQPEQPETPMAPPEPAASEPPPPPEKPSVPVDAAVDAPKPRPDASVDAGVDANVDAGVDAPGDGGVEPEQTATTPTVAMSGSGSGSGSAVEDAAAVDGAPTTAGTAANLLAYFPAGHVVSALVRFDRLRGTEWAEPTEKLLHPLPDYRGLFGDRSATIADKLDTLVISSPRPKDATATTLVAHGAMSRRQLRDFLANRDAPITWRAAKGGMLGRRTSKLMPQDRRVVLAPWKGWFVLAQPEDFADLLAPAGGSLDAREARGPLPAWLDGLREIEKEAGEDKRGPALVVTLESQKGRYKLPDVGFGVTSLPAPERVSIAVELVKQGWLVRGNIKFATDHDAAEFVQTISAAQQRIADSHVLSALLRKQHVLDLVRGLSFARAGERVSYGTSLSIADARAVLALAAATLDEYFAQPP